MGYPSQRDRLVEYEATWRESSRSDFRLVMLTLTQDIIDQQKEIEVVAFIDTKTSTTNLWDSSEFQWAVVTLGLVVRPDRVRWLHELDITHNILNLGAPGLRFDSPQETVGFVNRFAALFQFPPVASIAFRRKVLRSEVRVRFMSNKLRWMDEAEWLAASASLESRTALEDQFVQACGALRREGDVIRITLNRAFSEQAAASLNSTASRSSFRKRFAMHFGKSARTVMLRSLLPSRLSIERGHDGCSAGRTDPRALSRSRPIPISAE